MQTLKGRFCHLSNQAYEAKAKVFLKLILYIKRNMAWQKDVASGKKSRDAGT